MLPAAVNNPAAIRMPQAFEVIVSTNPPALWSAESSPITSSQEPSADAVTAAMCLEAAAATEPPIRNPGTNPSIQSAGPARLPPKKPAGIPIAKNSAPGGNATPSPATASAQTDTAPGLV